MKKDEVKKTRTLKESLLYSIIIFNWFIPVWIIFILFFNIKQIIVEGEISRGGISITCQSTDYDPKGGGGYVCEDSNDYSYEPVRYISFWEAMIEDSSIPLKLFPLTLAAGIGFGIHYHKSNNNEV